MTSKLRHWIAYVSVVCVMGMAGCSGGGPVVATASMRVDRNPVLLGEPVDVTLQFNLPSDLPPFGENDRVLLRFLFDDGEVMATYDHDPPTGTRDWHPGKVVKYTQRIFAPDLPYVGSVPVIVGLYSPASGKRLRLSGKDLGDHTYRAGTLTLEAPRTLPAFAEGWNPEEGANEIHSGWRWTQGQASMIVSNPHRDSVLYLRLEGRPKLFDAPQKISVMAGDRTVQTFPAASETPTDYEVTFSAADLGPEDEVKLTLKVDKTFTPANLPGGGADTRVLGVRMLNAFFEPR